MMATSLYLGMKSSQLDIKIDLLKTIFPFIKENNKETNIPNLTILFKYEFYMINVLSYDFYVFCPYKAMLGFMYKIKSSQIQEKVESVQNLTMIEVENEVEKYIDKTFATDSIFLYNYSYNSLACIFLGFEYLKITKNLNVTQEDIIEALELHDYIDVGNFINFILPKTKELIEKIPNFTKEEKKEKKGKIMAFLKKYPEYKDRLEKDRQ